MVTHLHQHVERVEAVDLVTQSDETVEFRLNALEDFGHHQSHHVFPLVEKGQIVGEEEKGVLHREYEKCFRLQRWVIFASELSANDVQLLTLMTKSVCVLPGEVLLMVCLRLFPLFQAARTVDIKHEKKANKYLL